MSSLATPIASPARQKLPASIFRRSEWINSVLPELEHFNVLVLRAPRLGGKSSSILQMMDALHPQSVNSVEFRSPVEAVLALQKISELLGCRDHDSDRDPASLQKRIISRLEETSGILIVDNFDFIPRAHLYLETFIRSLRKGRLIVSATEMEPVDADLALDFKSFMVPVFSKSEIGAFIRQSRVALVESEFDDLVDRIAVLTNGQPSLIRLLISNAAVEARPLSLSSLEPDFKKSEEVFNKKVISSLLVSDVAILKEAAWIIDYPTFELTIMDFLSPGTKRSLAALGILSRGIASEIFRLEVKRQSQSESAEIRRKLIDRLQGDSSYEGRKEKIRQLRELGERGEAAKVLNDSCLDIVSYGDARIFCDLTEGLSSFLSLPALEFRRYFLTEWGMFEKIFQEMKERLALNPGDDEKSYLYGAISRALHNLNRPEEAREAIAKSKEFMPKRGPLRGIALENQGWHMVKAKPVEALKLYEEALKEFDESDPQQAVFFCRALYASAYAHYILGNMERNFEFLKRRQALGERHRISNYTMISGVAIVDSMMSLGLFREAANQLDYHLDHIRKLSRSFGVNSLLDVKLGLSLYQGKFTLADQVARELSSRFKGIIRFELYTERLCYYLAMKRDWSGVRALVDQWASERGMRADDPRIRDFSGCEKFIRAYPEAAESQLQDILEKSKIPTKGHLSVHSIALEISWRDFCSIPRIHQYRFEHSASKIEALSQRSLLDLHEVHAEGKLSDRSRSVEERRLCENQGLFLLELRFLLAISMNDLFAGRVSDLQSLVARGVDLLPLLEPCEEMNLFHLLSALCWFRLQKRQQFLESLEKISETSPFSIAWMNLQEFMGSKKLQSKHIPTEREQNFIAKLLRCLQEGSSQELKLVTHQGIRKIAIADLDRELEGNWDLIVAEGSEIVTLQGQKVSFKGQELLKSILDVFSAQPGDSFSKEDLVVQLWHETYNPLVHDARIYTAIRRLRERLSVRSGSGEIILTRAGKYGLNPALRFLFVREVASSASRLNERQKWILDYLKRAPSIDRGTAQKLLKTSRTVVLNDLQDLVAKSLIRVEGSGKATQYRLI